MIPIVIKVSGKVIERPAEAAELWHAIAKAKNERPVVLVHGGGKQVDTLLIRLGEPIERIDGIRVTPESQIDAVAGVLAGQTNLQLVGALKAADIEAVGLSLGSAGVLECALDTSHDGALGRVGTPLVGKAPLIKTVLDSGCTPVVSSIGLDCAGQPLNVNADDAAACLAASLNAESMLSVSDVPGVTDTGGAVIESIATDQVEGMISSGAATGGMAAKLRSAVRALERGVGEVCITSTVGASALLNGEQPIMTRVTPQEVGAS